MRHMAQPPTSVRWLMMLKSKSVDPMVRRTHTLAGLHAPLQLRVALPIMQEATSHLTFTQSRILYIPPSFCLHKRLICSKLLSSRMMTLHCFCTRQVSICMLPYHHRKRPGICLRKLWLPNSLRVDTCALSMPLSTTLTHSSLAVSSLSMNTVPMPNMCAVFKFLYESSNIHTRFRSNPVPSSAPPS